MELLAQIAGLQLVHVPYKSSPDALNDLMAGRTQLMVEFQTVALQHVVAGRLRALAVAGGEQRKPKLPDVPTAIELGFPGFDASGWNGYFAPLGTPPEIIGRLNREIAAALKSPDYLDFAAFLGGEVFAGTPTESAHFVEGEMQRWSKVIRQAGLKLE